MLFFVYNYYGEGLTQAVPSIILGVIAVLSLYFIRNLTKYSHYDKGEIIIVEGFEIKDNGNELDESKLLLTEE